MAVEREAENKGFGGEIHEERYVFPEKKAANY